jgi:hypothetical protein
MVQARVAMATMKPPRPADTPLEAGVKDMIAARLDDARARFTATGPGHHGDSTASQSPAPGARPGSS